MNVADALAIVLAVGAGGAFIIGERSLARTEDLTAMYWLAVGAGSLYASVKLAKPGGRP